MEYKDLKHYQELLEDVEMFDEFKEQVDRKWISYGLE